MKLPFLYGPMVSICLMFPWFLETDSSGLFSSCQNFMINTEYLSWALWEMYGEMRVGSFQKRVKMQLNVQFLNANHAILTAHTWKRLQSLVIATDSSSLFPEKYLKRRGVCVLLPPPPHRSILCFQQSGSAALEWAGRHRQDRVVPGSLPPPVLDHCWSCPL